MTEHKLFICETCVREQRLAVDQTSRGQQLIAAVKQLLTQQATFQVTSQANPKANENNFALRIVSCLNGCLSPCNIALRCRGKYSLRFSRLNPEDAEAVLNFTRLYIASDDGDVAADQWPAALREKLTVRIAPIGKSN